MVLKLGPQRQRALLESLPEIPGAQRIGVESTPYDDCFLGRTVGYFTDARYRAPPDMTAPWVIDFYKKTLSPQDKWRYQSQDADIVISSSPVVAGQVVGGIPIARFERGTATILVNTDNMALRQAPLDHPGVSPPPDPDAAHDFTITVDSEGATRQYCD